MTTGTLRRSLYLQCGLGIGYFLPMKSFIVQARNLNTE